ncbi:hypothetical protein [Labrys neptuniae]
MVVALLFIIAGLLFCFTGIGTVIGVPMIILGFLGLAISIPLAMTRGMSRRQAVYAATPRKAPNEAIAIVVFGVILTVLAGGIFYLFHLMR